MTDDVRIIVADAVDGLALLEDESVDSVVTSPPYWGLRDYEVDGQIGLEETLGEYVERLVAVFRECRRVLAPHGTLWLNLGDTYASKTRGSDAGWDKSRLTNPGSVQKAQSASLRATGERHRGKREGFKPKDLLMVPARVALALQDDGWWLRSDVIWAKTNPMPGPWRDRPTSAHEHVFLLTKSIRYWFDTEAVREPFAPATIADGRLGRPPAAPTPFGEAVDGARGLGNGPAGGGSGRNVRDVWTISTEPSPSKHFAKMPSELARRCIVAGAARWVCTECGKPRERIVDSESSWAARAETGAATRGSLASGQTVVHAPGVTHDLDSKRRETVGWTDCGHGAYRPGVVLDPFLGSGTTSVAALREQRRAIGIELNPDYVALAEERIRNWHRTPPRPQEVEDGALTLDLEVA